MMAHLTPKATAFLGAVLLLTGCTAGPNYQRPAVPVPPAFRSPTPGSSDPVSLADLPWFEVFKDEQLQGLIRAALVNNYDLRDAVAHVDAARAVAGITRSNQFPQFGASGTVYMNRLSRDATTALPPEILPNQNRTFGEAALNL